MMTRINTDCKHKISLKHGSVNSHGIISYHGECSNCNKLMDLHGKIDENGNGSMIETIRGEEIQFHILIKDGKRLDGKT